MVCSNGRVQWCVEMVGYNCLQQYMTLDMLCIGILDICSDMINYEIYHLCVSLLFNIGNIKHSKLFRTVINRKNEIFNFNCICKSVILRDSQSKRIVEIWTAMRCQPISFSCVISVMYLSTIQQPLPNYGV